MTTWAEFADAAPELAAEGRRLLYRDGTGQALLATVRADAPPRIHPIWLAILDGGLHAFILRSAKRSDLLQDGRYALHTFVDEATLDEFSVRGHARAVGDPVARAAVAEQWYFAAGEEYELFEFLIESALLGRRRDADEWPPRYTSWSETGAASPR